MRHVHCIKHDGMCIKAHYSVHPPDYYLKPNVAPEPKTLPNPALEERALGTASIKLSVVYEDVLPS